jgi:hypothetical protein
MIRASPAKPTRSTKALRACRHAALQKKKRASDRAAAKAEWLPAWAKSIVSAAESCELWLAANDTSAVLGHDVLPFVFGVPWQNVTGGMVPFREDPILPGVRHADAASVDEIIFVAGQKTVTYREYEVTFLERLTSDVDAGWCFTPFPSTGLIMFERCGPGHAELRGDERGVLRAALGVFRRTAESLPGHVKPELGGDVAGSASASKLREQIAQ